MGVSAIDGVTAVDILPDIVGDTYAAVVPAVVVVLKKSSILYYETRTRTLPNW